MLHVGAEGEVNNTHIDIILISITYICTYRISDKCNTARE